MKHSFLTATLACALIFAASASAQDRDVIAGIPVNYDESKVGDYKATLPNPLVMSDGTAVTTAKQWYNKRRPEILKMFEEQQYGKWPNKRAKVHYSIKEDLGFGGEAIRKQVTIYFTKDETGPQVDVLIYLPKDANGPVPLLLNLSFFSNNMLVSDEGILPGHRWDPNTNKYADPSAAPAFPRMGARQGAANGEKYENPFNKTVKQYLKEGFGFASLCYTDFTPDSNNKGNVGVMGLYWKDSKTEREADEWGTISAWAWGVSHVIDYFEKDKDIDAKRVALTGCSRLGKTTIWTGAREPRIAMVIPSCSGEGGAALSRRNFGETVAHLTEGTRFPYQFARNYAQWGPDPSKMPMDAHMLIALIAPRPLLLSTGNTDNWSDPKGEFFAAVEAGPVYELLGKDSLGTNVMPEAEQPIYHTLGYVMHDGGHGVMTQDWTYYLEFMKKYL